MCGSCPLWVAPRPLSEAALPRRDASGEGGEGSAGHLAFRLHREGLFRSPLYLLHFFPRGRYFPDSASFLFLSGHTPGHPQRRSRLLSVPLLRMTSAHPGSITGSGPRFSSPGPVTGSRHRPGAGPAIPFRGVAMTPGEFEKGEEDAPLPLSGRGREFRSPLVPTALRRGAGRSGSGRCPGRGRARQDSTTARDRRG